MSEEQLFYFLLLLKQKKIREIIIFQLSLNKKIQYIKHNTRTTEILHLLPRQLNSKTKALSPCINTDWKEKWFQKIF